MLSLLATPALPLPARAFERAEFFATCAGRLDAISAHANARPIEESTEISEIAAEFSLLLDAVLPDALDEGVPKRAARRWRTGGWVEIAHLLQEINYSFDAGRAARAAEALQARVQTCLTAVQPGAVVTWLPKIADPYGERGATDTPRVGLMP